MKVKLMEDKDIKKTIDIKKLEQNIDKTLPMIRNNVILALNKQVEIGIKTNQQEYFKNAILLADLNEKLGNKKMNKLIDILNTKTSFIIVAALCTAALVYIFN